MDPLSITASIIAVAGLAASTGRAFRDLRALCKTLPGRLHALSNEVADIELVLYQVASVHRERANDPILRQNRSGIPLLLQEAKDRLEDLRDVVRKLIELGAQTKVPLFQAYAWRKEQTRLQALQEDIRTIKCNLNILLGASNSYVLRSIFPS